MPRQIINYSLTEIFICFIVVGYAAVDLVPCDRSRRVLQTSWGVISDGPAGSNYTQDSHCEWLICANESNTFISLSFRSMGTECSYDYVFVYDGDSFNSPLLGSFSGKTEPQQVVATSGYMLVLLYSDTNYVLDGFRAEFSITDCPNNCSSHGVCYNHQCICDNVEWGGFDCSRRLCPDNCGEHLGHGQCDIERGRCICHQGYSGYACDLFEKDLIGNKWHWLSHSEGGLQPRAAHSAVYIDVTDSLYVFGGYNLNQIISNLEIYSFETSTWTDENGKTLPDKNLYNKVDPGSVAKLIEYAGPDWEQKWGITSKSSFLRNLLYAVSENSTHYRRKQRHSHLGEAHKPEGRYGHAACAIANGFVIFGGKLKNGTLANDLWYYDVQTQKWHLRAKYSTDKPPQLTRHTLTCANEMIYLFGGSTSDGEFSSRLFGIRLLPDEVEQWEEIKPRGGKQLDVRVNAHSTVYHEATNSLIVYGGIVAGVARFSKLSDRMFAFQLDNRHWTEIHYTREHLREKFVPRERAFHTANIFGNYLVIFGGYSHRHNKEEICYDNQMYLYHLGCHIWVNPDILGRQNDSRYPKQQGVFAHASTVRNGHTLLLVGGYHGNVNGDLLTYVVPPMIGVKIGEIYDPESACVRHRNYGECSADPECGWCSADEQCYGRTIGANCTTNLQTTRCPGICPALGDCHSCLIHGHHYPDRNPLSSAARKLGLEECTWCVQNARCHHKDDNYGVCGLQEDSPSQIPGWWGAKGTEIVKPEQCREFDMRPGLTFVKYNYPVNLTQPDHVAIINATTVDFNSPSNAQLRGDLTSGGEMIARLMGFLRLPPAWQEMVKVCVSYCSATLNLEGNILANMSNAEQTFCSAYKWPANMSERIPVDFKATKTINLIFNSHQQSKMELQHHRDSDDSPKVFTFEYLEPHSNGTCDQYTNCLHCLTDSQCGWCELSSTCQSRLQDEMESCSNGIDWKFLTLQPSSCSNCSNYISCESCVDTNLCEWSIEDAKCTRIGQKPRAALSVEECPVPCYQRSGCEACLDTKGRCVWCEATQQCFSFSVYTSEYQFGLCREWLDQTFPLITTHENSSITQKSQEQCKSCSTHVNCSTCLSTLSCGWCYNSTNPMSGVCTQGDFNHPTTECTEILNSDDAKWAYAQCPDVDECGLGIHDCHPQAICTNTHGSFSCHCKKGFIGDGRTSCVRTCYNVCVHGKCQGEPDYKCLCDLGWYGEDCSENCGCNNHASCMDGFQKCDECHDYTIGEFCELCKPGSYGNATADAGCRKCDCNGHGNTDKGECDIETGVCFCEDNTEGDHCERCKPNYSGDPRGGRQCYYQCEPRGYLTESRGQGISSMKNYIPRYGGPPIRECLWIIKPDVEFGTPIIQLQINSSQLNVSCGENAVYVYDGLPDLLDMGSQTALSAVFCTEEALPSAVVESRSGALTVHYKQGLPNESFSAIYKVISCDNCEPPRECIKGSQCVCPEEYSGFDCEVPVCPNNCGHDSRRGTCDKLYGRCLCNEGWTGPGCETQETKLQLVFVELFNTERLADIYDHLRHTLPRFGHSLVSDRRGSLWMFGGYSLSHGALNDIRLFDTRNITWMQVTVESTGDSKMPQGRYFHAADIVHSKQAIFIFGGLTKHQNGMTNRTLNDFWQFDIQNSRWSEIGSPLNYQKLQGYWSTDKWPPAVYGHTLTYCRNDQEESLMLIGGDSPQYGFLNSVWEYKFDNQSWHPVMTKGRGPPGIIGHSTVYHQETNSLYIFGGYVYDKQVSELSNSLYRLDYKNRIWIELTDSGVRNLPKPRFFHSAVTTDHYMLILGGRIYPWNISDTLYAFSYSCNQWINLMTESVEKIGPYPKQTYAQAMTVEPDGDAAYVIGGWGIDTQTSVLKIELPMDICNLFSTKSNCLKVPGCAYCADKNDDQVIKEICHRNTENCPLGESQTNTSRVSNPGRFCDERSHFSNCSTIPDCATCSMTPNCVYCNTSSACVSTNEAQECHAAVCPYSRCVATNCIQCNQLSGCEWSYSRRQCEISTGVTQEANRISVCPAPCVNYTTCSSCLEAPDCHWSTQLDECIAASYQSIYCAGGVCGLVLEAEDKNECPKPCSSFKQCSDCIMHAFCGWCAAPGETGDGVCTEGSSKEPMTGTCNRVIATQQNLLEDDIQDTNTTYTWHYMTCPKENECQNGHHNCDNESQICVDLDRGFKCECGEGYKKVPGDACEPVCPLGCVRGQCVEPKKCLCDFGYVGANCSIQCLCHGHANCEGPDKLDQCLECHNNTMGDRCQNCKPLFVGNPANNTPCIPCLEFCNGHTSTCADHDLARNPNDFIPIEEIKARVGPSRENATCLRCNNHTTGGTCDDCLAGFFRGTEQLTDPCKPCECHGHGSTCDTITGDKCDCKNNTISDDCNSNSKNAIADCWKVQCIKCKEGYLGTPTFGHQCYKHMSVDSKMCFDSHSIDDCKSKPNPLRPGEVSFFVIQPRFMNVDIRIMVDVTQGRLNVFMSTHDDTFTAAPNLTTGANDIKLDAKYRTFDNNGTLNALNDHVTIDQEAKGLRTYITVTHPKTLLLVRNLQDRLVITLPEENHKLETTRFYLVLQALDSPNDTDTHKVSYGVVFSRQDQLHIDLFVFFSVFFSCFFLFLAACVVAWKAKQAADVRRARRRHVVEMLHMAKRPFAGVTLNLHAKPKPKKATHHHDVRPVAIEPTNDGVAAVATVFVSLPGGQNPPIKLALASSLILLARQFPTGGRMFLRRRSVHAAPPT